MRENGELASDIQAVHGKREPNVRVVGKIEPTRHDADNAEDLIIERDALLQYRRTAAETTLPQAIADKSDSTSQALALLLRQEVATEDGLHFERGGPALGSVDCADSLGLCAAREGYHAIEGRRRFAKHHGMRAVHAESAEMPIRPAVRIEDAQGAVGIGERQGAEEDGVYETENGDVSAEAEGQREDRDGGKHWRAAKEAQRVTQILPET